MTATALIMVVVFGAFLLFPDRMLKQFGLGLAVAIFLDAFVIRSLILPAIMQLLGNRAWWLPSSIGRRIPASPWNTTRPQVMNDALRQALTTAGFGLPRGSNDSSTATRSVWVGPELRRHQMLKIRRDAEFHQEEGGWFRARWHFSFDRYRDPDNMGIGPLRVFNDDRLVPGADWPMHPHADVEGITYVVEGTFEHADSLGQNGKLQPGGVQRMTLGSGALHSERNGSKTEPMRFLQLWILPETAGLQPSLEQRQFTYEDRRNRLLRVLGRDGDVVTVHQDAAMYVAALDSGARVDHTFGADRAGYLYLIGGTAHLNDDKLEPGDAAKIYGPELVTIESSDSAELILVDVPKEHRPVGVWAR